jgi:hypothetical protein
LKLVPDSCDRVAWLDCDVVFECDNWAERASLALDHFTLLRLFGKRFDLSPDVLPDQICAGGVNAPTKSVVRERAAGEASLEDLSQAPVQLQQCRSPGLAWASRRELLEKHGFYDACILGSGDRAILYAALGQFGHAANALRMNARRFEHYLAWARPFFESVHGQVGHIHGRLFHLWHGERNNREYRERQRLLEEFDFDPYTDIAIDPTGCWRWNSDKPDFHRSIRNYFQSRKEDGVSGAKRSESL